ncbi:MAG TPA: SCO family protein [Candidatus Acidoferrales bacterium]|nr:SCO family protein [Candidatus Acidoferrales bacterium]
MRLGEQISQPGNPGVQKALWGLLILVLIGVVGAGIRSLILPKPASKQALSVGRRQPPAYGSVPDFSFIERSGQRVERAEFLGRIWVVDLIYTRCPDTCPLQSAEMARLQAEFVNEADIRLVSITVDPARDTLAVLSRYAKRFGADPKRWLFLTGEKEAIYRFVQEGLRLPVMDPGSRARGAGGRGVTLLHSSRFVLVDREARIRGYYESSDMESLRQLREDVKTLLRKE